MKNSLQIQERNFFQRIDGNFAWVIFSLNVIGLINLYSATHGVSESPTITRLFWQQLVWLSGGWSLFFLLTITDYQIFKRFAPIFYLLNCLALVAVMLFGKSYYGAQRWLDLGFFRYQPSETVKLTVVFVLARYLSNRSYDQGLGFKDLFIPALIMGAPFALTVKQPDLGTALLIAAIAGSMIIFVKVKRNVVITTALAALITVPIAWNFGLKEYQKNRVRTFLYPSRDPRGSGYNSIQSKIAVGSGRILGKGFRKGTQSQLEFIPERHSDFIFSVLSEEHGFLGSTATIGLFLILYVMALRIASQARDKFGSLVVVGILALIFWHTFINIGMVIGILPIVGVPLPLLSYGGSSMLTVMAGLGIISGVAYRRYLF